MSIYVILVALLILVAIIIGVIIMMTRKKVVAGKMATLSYDSVMVDTPYGKMVKGHTQPAQQGACNSCWAISVAQTISDRLRLAGEISSTDQLNYYALHDMMSGSECRYGAAIMAGMDYAQDEGVPLMSDTRDRIFDDRAIPSDRGAPRITVDRWYTIPISGIKDEVRTRGSVVAVINLYPSFNYFSGDTYVPGPNERAGGDLVHMVSIVGYDNDSWILRNSYGHNWGHNGYFKIPYSATDMFYQKVVYAPIIGTSHSVR